MANEAVLIYQTEIPIPWTVADGTAITKGALLSGSDLMAAGLASGADFPIIGGIASTDKIASNGVTKLGLYRKSIFKCTLSGSCSAGDALGFLGAGDNKVGALDVTGQTLSGSRCCGTALETGTNGETILVEINVSQVYPSI